MKGVKSSVGDRLIRSDGYAIVYQPNWPSSWKYGKNKGWMMEHKFVIESHIGRMLDSCELIHHKNHVRSDNRIDNLELTNRRAHAILHAKENGKQIGHKKCILCGNELYLSSGAVREAKYCIDCFRKIKESHHKAYPNVDLLVEQCREFGFEHTGKEYGVSSSAIRKHIIKCGRELPITIYSSKRKSNSLI